MRFSYKLLNKRVFILCLFITTSFVVSSQSLSGSGIVDAGSSYIYTLDEEGGQYQPIDGRWSIKFVDSSEDAGTLSNESYNGAIIRWNDPEGYFNRDAYITVDFLESNGNSFTVTKRVTVNGQTPFSLPSSNPSYNQLSTISLISQAPVSSYTTSWSLTGGSTVVSSNNSYIEINWNTVGVHNLTANVTYIPTGETYTVNLSINIEEPPSSFTTAPLIIGNTSVELNKKTKYNLKTELESEVQTTWKIIGGTIIEKNDLGIVVNWSSQVGEVLASVDYQDGLSPYVTNLKVKKSQDRTSPYTGYTSNNENYIKTSVYQDPTTVENSNLVKKIETIKYMDALGRPKQKIAIEAGGNKEHIITHIEYDEFGKKTKNFLPYASINSSIAYRTEARNETSSFYNTAKYENTSNPYTEIQFEGNILNRVIKSTFPGEDWSINNLEEHTIRTRYDIVKNEGNVLTFGIKYDDSRKPFLIKNNSSDESVNEALYKEVIKNENWIVSDGKNNTTERYTDYQGRVLLKRTYNENIPHNTYYVYDNLENLVFVLPPVASDRIERSILQNDDSWIDYSSLIEDLGYTYHYDYRNNLIEKKIPGKGTEYIIYDKLNRPILTQDANLRAGKNNKWLFTKYDVFDRVVYTGIYSPSTAINRAAFQADAYSSNYNYDLNEIRNTTGFTSGGATINYTKAAFPTSNLEVLTVNYYDDYNFNMLGISPRSSVYSPYTDRTKTLATGSLVKVLGTNSWIVSVTKYDEKGRPVYMHSKNNYLDSEDITHMKLDFTGQTLETKSTHKKANQSDIVTLDKFTYDHAQRLLKHSQVINGQPEELIAFNEYDELGQLVEKKVGGSDASETDYTQVSALQTIDYDYNIRGWLKSINDPETNDANKLFAFGINYNDPTETGVRPLYNGNISETHWRTQSTSTSKRMYSYEYDALNRITDANSWNTNYNLSNVGYDKNGNISQLTRNGQITSNNYGTIDNLSYTYYPGTNQLKKVTDSSNKSQGFDQASTATSAYDYDDNGNMTEDQNKNITKIVYNHLNLPKRIEFASQSSTDRYIEYVFDATGVKLSKTVQEEYLTESQRTYYDGKYIYKKSSYRSPMRLEFFNHPEGYVEPVVTSSGVEMSYVYQYKDHLGNIRLSYKNNNGTLEIVEEKNYYPFGLEHKGYNSTIIGTENNYFNFNGKELNESLGLNVIEMDFRQYDPALGRFNVIDPLAEERNWLSPYNFAQNNPILRVDPTGLLDDYAMDDEGNIELIKETDDNFDTLVDSEGVSVGKVNKGYLSDGINIEENGLLLDVDNKEDFHSYLKFTTDLSVAVNKEIGGFILDSDSGFDDIYVSRFKESKPHSAEGLENFINSDSYSIKNKELNLSGNKHKANAWFHTHPDIMSSGYGSSKPSPGDRNTTKTLQIPGAILGGWGGIGLINTDGTFKRWGN